jgi:hypothetical protein
MIKIAIVVLFIAVLLSLSSGLVFLLKDMNIADSKRTLYALGIRVTLALSLMILIAYGIQTSKLRNTAPWSSSAVEP